MTPSPRPPVLTLALVSANIVAAFAVLVNPGLATEFGFRLANDRPITALTCLFLHENVLHLLGNLLFLAAVGSAVEMATGAMRFGVVYFVSGLAGVALHAFMTRNLSQAAPLIGASGCIAGCIGYYALRYQSIRIPVIPRIALPVLALTGIWVALQAVGGLVRIGDTGGTAYWAHLGGFTAGVVLSLVFRTPDFGEASASRHTVRQMAIRGPAAVRIAAQRHLESHPNDLSVLAELADACRGLDDRPGEIDVRRRMAALQEGDARIETLLRLADLNAFADTSVLDRLKMVTGFRESAPDLARRILQSAIADADEKQRPDAIVELIALEWDHDRPAAQALLAQLEGVDIWHPAVQRARERGWLS